MASTKPDIRVRLADLGERREAQDAQCAELSREIERTLRDAYGDVSVAECARLLKMHRTTVYRVYRPHAA